MCLVAHMDTVEKEPPKDIYYDQEAKVMWSPQLLGADDRAGIYAILQIIEAGYRPSVIFTKDEEQGCAGTQAIATKIPDCPLENLKAIFQLDRRGSKDCVFYDCDNQDFTKYVESFGFEEDTGSFSDISILGPAWGVAAVNLSVGYYNEHSKYEYLKCNELDETIEKVKKILDNVAEMPNFSYIESKKVLYMGGFDKCHCVACGKTMSWADAIVVNNGSGNFDFCEGCYRAYYGI